MMTPDAFVAWAATRGLPIGMAKKLIRLAATPEEMKAAFDEMEPAPPIYTLDDIVGMTESNYCGSSPSANGFIIVGGCPNGDPIAVDVADEPGSVWYIAHDNMSDKPMRQAAIRIFKDVIEMMNRYGKDGFPYDYYDAEEQVRAKNK